MFFFQRNSICGRLLWVNFRLSICDRPFLTVYFMLFIFRCHQLKTIKARTNIWFLIIIPPLGILFFLVERYFIAANRQVSTHFCANFAHFCYKNVLFCSKTIIFVLEPCILRSHDCSRCKNATLQADANFKKIEKFFLFIIGDKTSDWIGDVYPARFYSFHLPGSLIQFHSKSFKYNRNETLINIDFEKSRTRHMVGGLKTRVGHRFSELTN